MTEYPLQSFLRNDPNKRMKQAWQYGISVPWIRTAEQVISGRFAGAAWHLEDPDGETIDDEYPDKDAIRARDLIDKPQALVTELPVSQKKEGSGLKEITSRHMGLCGSAGYFLDQRDGYGIPNALLYLRPDLMYPVPNDQGVLSGWNFNPGPNGTGGTKMDPEDVLHFKLQEPDDGFFPPGLVESALTKIAISQLADNHVNEVLNSGGRLSGILAPREGAITDDNVYQQLIRDWRNVVEQPNAAKRLQVVRAPVDFTTTTMTMNELGILALMSAAADDLMAFWRVPLSMIGIGGSTGLNSGDTRKYDEAALWQGAVHDRIKVWKGVMQSQLLDLWIPLLGWAPQLVVEEPEFDDDSPKYDKLGKSISVPLTNAQRLGLIGFDPTGDPVFDNQVWLPITQALVYTLPTPPGVSVSEAAIGEAPAEPEPKIIMVPNPGPAPVAPAAVPPAAPPATKAKIAPRLAGFHESLIKLRHNVEAAVTPRLKSKVQAALDEQKREAAAGYRANAAHIATHLNDTQKWWDSAKQDQRMAAALAASMGAVAETVRTHVRSVLAPGKASVADQAVVAAVMTKGSARVTRINDWTRDEINKIIVKGVQNGDSPRVVGDAIEEWSGWDEYRAERIATTELMRAYNSASILSFGELGSTEVQAIDGDQDEMCAARDGQTFSLDEAAEQDDLEHPSGSLVWLPIVDYGDLQ